MKPLIAFTAETLATYQLHDFKEGKKGFIWQDPRHGSRRGGNMQFWANEG